MRKTLSGMALTSVLLAMLPGVATADIFKRHHDHVLGTSLDIVVNAPSEIDADKAEEAILKEIERLRGVFSTYDNSSEISRLNRPSTRQCLTIWFVYWSAVKPIGCKRRMR